METFISYSLAIGLGFIALVAWRKQWHVTGLLVAVMAALCGLASQSWVQNLVQAKVLASRSSHQAISGRFLEFQEGMKELAQRIADQQAKIDQLAGQLQAQQKAKESPQPQDLTNASQTLQSLQERLQSAQSELTAVRALAKDLLAGTQQESLWATQSDRVVLMPGPDGGTKIYLRLQQVPHIETLRLTWKEQNLDPSRVRLHKNIVVTRFQESVRKLSKDPFLVTYVPDSEHSADLATMNIVDGSVEVDGQPVENLLQ